MSSFGPAAGGGADDDAAGEAVLLAELADDAAQAAALLARVDLARHADVVHGRHEDQEAARHGGVRGEPGALGAERLLGHLDDDLLAFLQQLFDLGLGALLALAIAPAAAAPCPPLAAGRRTVAVGRAAGSSSSVSRRSNSSKVATTSET